MDNKKVIYGAASALTVVLWVMWRNNERAKLRGMILSDARSVLIADIESKIVEYLPMLCIKTADTAWKELSPTLLPIPAGAGKVLQTTRQILELLTDKEHGAVKMNPENPSAETAATAAPSPEMLTDTPTHAEPLYAAPRPLPMSAEYDVFGNPTYGEVVDFEEWASTYPKP